jgi:hypothetical protein
MQSHDHTTVDIAGCYEGKRNLEITTDYAVEYIIGFLVRVVGASLGKRSELLPADVIAHHRRIMPCTNNLYWSPSTAREALHAIATKHVIELWRDLSTISQC